MTQRPYLPDPEMIHMLEGVSENSDDVWAEFDPNDSQNAASKNTASVQLAKIFKLRPVSPSRGDIAEFYVKVKHAVDCFMEALSLDPYFEKAHDTLEVILPLLKALFAEGIFFSSFPDKIGDVIGSRYKRPGNINLLPTELALACQWVPYADEFFLQEPAPRERDSSPSRRHERRDSRSPDGRTRRPDHGRPAGSPRRLTPRPSYSRYSRTACSPARSPSRPSARPSPRRPRDASPTRDLADAWMPPRGACARCLRGGHRAEDCRYLAFCPFHGLEGHRWEDCRAHADHVRQTKRALSQLHL